MSRRKKSVKRPVLPDARYDSQTVSKFINALMLQGKKSTAERIFYGAMDLVESRTSQPGVNVFKQALANLIVYTDALDLLVRLHVRRRHTATASASAENRNVSIDLASSFPGGARRLMPLRPYAIIASVYNLGDRLDEFLEAFAGYRERYTGALHHV